jgi:hypothetical protein
MSQDPLWDGDYDQGWWHKFAAIAACMIVAYLLILIFT